MREIELTQGKVAIVDDCDFEELSKYKWHHRNGYARRTPKPSENNGQMVFMHRQIMGCRHMDKIVVDHINMDSLDNRRENLRRCTQSENLCNRGIPSNNISGHKGIRYEWYSQKWKVKICKDKKIHWIGSFSNKDDAIAAQQKALSQLHGDFANFNINKINK